MYILKLEKKHIKVWKEIHQADGFKSEKNLQRTVSLVQGSKSFDDVEFTA